MTQVAITQVEFNVLVEDFKKYVEGLRKVWIDNNRVRSSDVYEVMNPIDRACVDAIPAAWARYITPLSEVWWKDRGFGINWPDDNSKPVQYYILENE